MQDGMFIRRRILDLSGPPVSNEVNFYDYDGTLLHGYTLKQMKKMKQLPAGPQHDGLIFDGWNWTLEQIQAMNMPVDVGALYDTEPYTFIYEKQSVTLSSPLILNVTVTNQASSNALCWSKTGVCYSQIDNNTPTYHGNAGNHTLNLSSLTKGNHIIRVLPLDGVTIGLGNSTYGLSKSSYIQINSIKCGKKCTGFNAHSFEYSQHRSIEYIVMPNPNTFTFAEYAWYGFSLPGGAFVIPPKANVTYMGYDGSTQKASISASLYAGSKVIFSNKTIPSLANGFFSACSAEPERSVERMIVPNVTTITNANFNGPWDATLRSLYFYNTTCPIFTKGDCMLYNYSNNNSDYNMHNLTIYVPPDCTDGQLAAYNAAKNSIARGNVTIQRYVPK